MFVKNNWLNIVLFLGVLVSTVNGRNRLQSLTGLWWWFLMVFSIAFYLSAIYEIPIKSGINKGLTKGQIARSNRWQKV
jgi:hypothetical protein